MIRQPTRYQGYLGASPTVEWLNRETGMKAHMRPYVHDLTDDTVDAFVSDTRYDVLAGFGLCVDHVYVSSVNSVSQSQTVFFRFFFCFPLSRRVDHTLSAGQPIGRMFQTDDQKKYHHAA